MPRKEVAPVWTRSFPISREPKTLGEHLKKKRFQLGLRQEESALKLAVSCRTLSDWETGRIFPSLTLQPRIVEYLGYDPFVVPPLETPKGNEPQGVAFLALDSKATTGQRIRGWRIGLKKTRKQMAAEMGISVKTLWGWENDLWLPGPAGANLVAKGFPFGS